MFGDDLEPKDGGQAFPMAAGTPTEGQWVDGMSLRDWFAGQALAGILAGSPDLPESRAGFAKTAYEFADAMLAARRDI